MSVKHGLLAILTRRSMHGYELRHELVDELGDDWAVNFGQVYTTLDRLMRDGLVVQSETVSTADAPDRKLYTITPSGRSELRRWFLSPVQGTEAARDELYAKVLLGLTGDVDVGEVIQTQRTGLLRAIGSLTKAKEQLDADLDLAAMLRVDLSIARTDAVLDWLDTAETRIRKAVAGGPGGVGAHVLPMGDEVSASVECGRKERM